MDRLHQNSQKEFKQIEKELRESEEKFRHIFENSALGIFRSTPEGKYELVNKTFARILGFNSPQKMLHEVTDISKLYKYPKDREKIKKEFADKGFVKDYEVVANHPSKKTVWISVNAKQLRQADGSIYYEGTIQDITEKKIAEEKLKESREEIGKILDNSMDGILLTAPDGSVYSANPAACAMFGRTEKEICELGREALVDVSDPRLTNFLKTRREQGKAKAEFNLLRKDGTIFSAEVSSALFKDKDGNIRSSMIIRDTTEWKKEEERRRKSDERFRIAQDMSPDGFTIFKPVRDDQNRIIDFTWVYQNAAVARMNGTDPEKVVGQRYLKLFPGIRATQFFKAYKQVAETGEPMTFEDAYVGETIEKKTWFRIVVVPMHENIAILAHDITERKIAVENLKNTFNLSPSIIAKANLKTGFYVEANQAVSRILGYSIEEFTSKPIAEFIHPDDNQDTEERITDQLGGNEIHHFENRFKCKDGSYKWISWNANSANDQGIVLGIGSDITERKKAELELKINNEELIKSKDKAEESEHKVRSMFENTQIGILYCDTTGKILEVNPAIVEILGSPSAEATKKINILTFKPLIENGFAQNITKCITEKQIITEDTVYTTKWGKTIFMKYYLVPVIVDEQVTGVWANLNNLSDLYAIQNQLKIAKEKAEESDRLKSAFLANMSHEIRTPMNGIIGFTNLLKKPSLTGEKQKNYIDIIQKSGFRMLSTVNNIIDISKIESRSVEIKLSEVNITEQLEYFYSFFKPEAAKKGIHLKLNHDLSKQNAIINTDPEKFHSIFTNLMKNAIKFTKQGFIELGCKNKNNQEFTELEFYVKDSGIGIPTDRMDAIFDRFVQADIEDKDAVQGSGLGLAISKAYVEMLGGKIWVESELGKGTVFHFTIANRK